ncbi:MAG TPA: glutamine--fructose-6-phosphate transaminase (isomerizing) [Bacteriovoracaceae bacterium]|nr:glutamine--fructose-6-phosphate transaminase (isomerizing) [Bacteriovoracaceae bacterium]
MCGIVGYSGPGNSIVPILEGLTRLEYRGYDSAGICLKINDELKIFKKEGKLDNLKSLLTVEKPFSTTGIGHTRWATHGGVTKDNAHPHGNETFAVVHNGIIENASSLKKELIAEGFVFKSQTDSEVFLVLLTKFFKQNGNTLQSIAKAFNTITGNSAFVIMEVNTEKLYCIKKSAPLVLGENESTREAYVSSDPFALVGFAPKIYFPQDAVICESTVSLKDIQIKFYELDLTPSTRYKTQDNVMTMDTTTKGSYEHFMLKEVHEQPSLIDKLGAYYIKGEGRKHLDSLKGFTTPEWHLTACGTAWHAGLIIKNYFEQINRQRASVEIASEFRYKNPILNKSEVGLFISQSGETADTLACQELCLAKGIPTYSIVNVEGSTLFRNADKNFLIHAGVEIGVASTKAFTLQVLTGYLMARAIEGTLDNPDLFSELQLLSHRIGDLCTNADNTLKEVAGKIYAQKGFIFTGRGKYFPVALEGALKLKEIAYVHAEGYAAGELKHGPIALIDENIVNIAIVGPELLEKTISNVEEVKARRGIIVMVGPKDLAEVEHLADHYIGLNFDGLPNLSPLYVNVALQFLAYHIAKLKGTDIDKPRNLAKSVTVE